MTERTTPVTRVKVVGGNVVPLTDDELDHSTMGKGRYARRTAEEVAVLDPQYLVWAYETWNPKPCSKVLYDDTVKEVAADRQDKRVSKEQDDG